MGLWFVTGWSCFWLGQGMSLHVLLSLGGGVGWFILGPSTEEARTRATSRDLGELQSFFFFINLFIYLFIYLWLCWVFVSVRGLSPVVANGGHFSSRCAGLSLSRPLPLRSTGSRHASSVVVAHGPSCSLACGILPDRGTNPCPLHWQADSQPLRHQGGPTVF